jgi:peptide subunit release factor 1 (eRF1)
MFDDLLGRTELRERIEELEAEKHHLEQELDAESERRADAVTERQRAEERVNRLEDRVTELEDRVERLQSGDAELPFRTERQLRGEELAELLARLESIATEPEGLLTAYVTDGHDIPDPVRETFGDRTPLVSRAAPCLAISDDFGLFGACLSVPVPPEPFVEWDDAVRLERSWCRPAGEYTLALVRSDLFAMGVYDGRDRTAFHGFDSDLKSQHSKGGFSQSRFERLRDEQIADHIERCRAALDERPDAPLYVVGERTVVDEFADMADVTAAVSATGQPEDALATAFDSFWTVRVRTV